MNYYNLLFSTIVAFYYCGGIKPVQSDCTDKKPWCARRTMWCKGKFAAWMKRNCCKTCGGDKQSGGSGGGATFKYVKCKEVDPCVDDMNTYRRLHESTGDLKCDQQLTKDAQKWADTLAKEHKFIHAVGTGEGENLYSSSVWPKRKMERVPTCIKANKAWYDEIKRWDGNTSDRKSVYKLKIAAAKSKSAKHLLEHKYAVGHFTAMVWKATTRVGFGFATFDRPGGWRSTVVVARFLAMGNYIPMGPTGPFAKNVGKLKGHGKKDEIFTEIVDILNDEDEEMIGRQRKKYDVKEIMDSGDNDQSSLKTKEQKDDMTEKVMAIVSEVLDTA